MGLCLALDFRAAEGAPQGRETRIRLLNTLMSGVVRIKLDSESEDETTDPRSRLSRKDFVFVRTSYGSWVRSRTRQARSLLSGR